MSDSDVSLDDLTEHVRDLRTIMCGLARALGRQPALDAEKLQADLLEICLPTKGSPHTVADDLGTLIGRSILQGKAEEDRDRGGTAPGHKPA